MTKKLKKYGKDISYEIQENGAWVMVKDGGLKYLHLTSKVENAPKPNTPPIFVNKKGIWDLLVHFGCDKEDLINIYKKS